MSKDSLIQVSSEGGDQASSVELISLNRGLRNYDRIINNVKNFPEMRIDNCLRFVCLDSPLSEIFGKSVEELLGKKVLDYIFQSDRKRFIEILDAHSPGSMDQCFEVRMYCLGRTPRVSWSVRRYSSQGRSGWQLKSLGVDFCDWVSLIRYSKFLENHDPLTGAHNRSGFIEKMDSALSAPDRSCALLYIDLDRFNLANELLGHDCGDEILKIAKERICSSMSREGFVGRLGADQFVLFFDVDSKEKAYVFARSIMSKLGDPYSTARGSLSITASVVVSVYPEDGSSSGQLLSKAESATREAKSKVRNGLVFGDDKLHQQLHSELEFELGLRRALLNNSFELFFQPKYRLADEVVEGMEVLLRWSHPEWGPCHLLTLLILQKIMVWQSLLANGWSEIPLHKSVAGKIKA